MGIRAVILLGGLLLARAIPLDSAQAGGGRLPNSLYPAGAHITYRPHYSNHEMDCAWGFFCDENLPVFHLNHQDALHRRAGWAQFASWRSRGQRMTFNLFASRYATGDDPVLNVPWSARAYADLRAAAGARGYTALPGALDLLPAGGGRRCTGLRTADGPVDLAVMACWRGRGEVEAIVMYTHGSGRTQETALHDLARQVLTALRQT